MSLLKELEMEPQNDVQLSEYFSFVPPADWAATASFDNLPLRLLAYGRIQFQPEGVTDVFLKWQIANWLEGQPEWDIFYDMLMHGGKPTSEELSGLYSVLLRIRIDFLADYSVMNHPGLGPALVIDYNYTDWSYKGRVMYTPSPTGPNDVQIISYEGAEPSFSTYLIDALQCMDTCRSISPAFLLQKLFV